MTDANDTFREIYDAHFDAMLRALRKLGVREADLEDVAHDLFVAVHRHLGDYDGVRPVRAWLYGFAYRFASDYRKLARHRSSAAPDIEGMPDSQPNAELLLDDQRRRLAFDRALAELDEDKRVALVLHDQEGLTAPEIAEILQIPVNTVYTRIRLAREELRARLVGAESPKDRVRNRVLLSIGGAIAASVLARDAEAAVSPAPKSARAEGASAFQNIRAVAGIAFILGTGVGAGTYAAFVAKPLVPSVTQHADVGAVASAAPSTMPSVDDSAAASRQTDPAATMAASTSVATTKVAANAAPNGSPSNQETPDQKLESERALIDRARAALARGDTQSALEALKIHQTRFGAGRLSEERELIAVQALTRAGDPSAKARAQAFRRQYPNSVFLPAVDRLSPP